MMQYSENIYKQLIDHIEEVLFIVSLDWRKVHFVSPSYEKIWGRTCNSLLEEPFSWIDSLHPDDRGKVLEYIDQKAGGNLDEIIFPDYRVIKPDGSMKWIKARCFPIFDDNGHACRIAGIAVDISSRKKLEYEKEERINSLKKSLDEVKTLKGVLPICSNCNSIRNKEGLWEGLEEYLSQYTDAKFTHSICPICIKKLYPDLADEILSNVDPKVD